MSGSVPQILTRNPYISLSRNSPKKESKNIRKQITTKTGYTLKTEISDPQTFVKISEIYL